MNGRSTDRTVVDTCETTSHLSITPIAQVSAEGLVLIEFPCRLFEEHGTGHLGSNTSAHQSLVLYVLLAVALNVRPKFQRSSVP